MRSPYARQSNLKVVLYAICAAVVLGICVVVLQDIKIPTEHVSQKIEVNFED